MIGENSIVYTDKIELEFQDGDILKTTINELPTINFSERKKQLLVKGHDNHSYSEIIGKKSDIHYPP